MKLALITSYNIGWQEYDNVKSYEWNVMEPCSVTITFDDDTKQTIRDVVVLRRDKN